MKEANHWWHVPAYVKQKHVCIYIQSYVASFVVFIFLLYNQWMLGKVKHLFFFNIANNTILYSFTLMLFTNSLLNIFWIKFALVFHWEILYKIGKPQMWIIPEYRCTHNYLTLTIDFEKHDVYIFILFD